MPDLPGEQVDVGLGLLLAHTGLEPGEDVQRLEPFIVQPVPAR